MSKFLNSIAAFFRNVWAFLKKNRKISIPAGVLLLIVLVLVVRNGSSKSQTIYQTDKAARGDLTAMVGATGSVRAAQSTTLIWQTAGTVEKVNAQVGDQVQKGDTLASLTKSSLPQNIILAEADLVSAQQALNDLTNSDTSRAQAVIALKSAQDAYDKANNYRKSLDGLIDIQEVTYTYVGNQQIPHIRDYKGYADASAIAKADNSLALAKAKLDDAQRTYERVKNGPNPNDLAAAQARVDAAQTTLNAYQITAPFNGTVTQANPMPGDQVSVGKVAFRVDDLSSLLVDVQVSEIDINSISVRQPVTLTFDAISGATYHGEVTKVSQAGDVVSGSVNFTVTVKLTDADQLVKPGMTAAVNIIVNQVKSQLLIPNRAVRLVDGKRVVYILLNGKPQQVPVTLGASSDTMSVALDGGLKEGDLIILNPPAQFQGPGGGPFGGGGG